MPFTLPSLPYATDALEPKMDKLTMEIHQGKHHAAYVNNLNKALESAPQLASASIEQLLANDCAAAPENIRTAVRNHGGGHYNHTIFWGSMGPNAGGEPKGKLAEAIKSTFGSFDQFKEKFSATAVGCFGSGWAWLVKNPAGKLDLYATSNQVSPANKGDSPIITVDVWEHAYYLKYQNRRAEWVGAWWSLVNWKEAEKRFLS